MPMQHVTVETVARPKEAAPVLRGRWLLLARAGWAALVALNLSIFTVAIPALYAQRGSPPEAVRVELAQLGISESLYAAYFTALLVLFGLGCFAVASVIAYGRSDEPMALFVSVFLVLLGAVNAPNVQALVAAHPAWSAPLKFSWAILWAAMLLFVFLFPDGRFVPRWTKALVGLLILGTLIAVLFVEGSLAEPPDALAVVLMVGLLAGIAAQIYRYRRVSTVVQRQQTKWVVFGLAVAIMIQVAGILAEPLFVSSGLSALIYEVADTTVITLAYFLIPLSIGIAILRYRLFDIDLIINRALVYGMLTAVIAGLYVLTVGGIGTLLQARGNLFISLLGAGLVAVLFQPLRGKLQRAVNHLMYGERDDPYAVISRLGERLEETLSPEAVLPVVVETIREALKLPYAAIALERGLGIEVIASAGEAVKKPQRLPLTYQNEPVGELLLAPRAGEDDFSNPDRRLLEDLARQAGVAAHAVRLTADLQRARERLVSAREEERRRLRRDLHDGLGPQLSSQTLTIDAVRSLMRRDPDAAEELLVDLKGQAQDAISDIRRLVYSLRPPALDDLGLIGAIRETAAQYAHNGLDVAVETPDELPPLPAAVEVAVYRVVQEAVTNVARHAKARFCSVSLAVDEATTVLRLEVRDDGRGMPEERDSGVGLTSMRERAAELGGSLAVDSLPGGGVAVRAQLPLPEEE